MRQKEHSWRVVLARVAHAFLAQRLAATRRDGTPVAHISTVSSRFRDWSSVAL
jgi:hypothetical protein